MASFVLEKIACEAAVRMGSGNDLSLLKIGRNTIHTNLDPACVRLVRGKVYRVTFEEVDVADISPHHQES